MKINNISQGEINRLSGGRSIKDNEASGNKAKSKESRKSASQLSELSKLVSRARVKAAGIDNVREEKIAEVRQRLAEGYYNSPEVRDELASRLAEKLKSFTGR